MFWQHLTLWTVSCAAVLCLKLGEIRSNYMSFTMTENIIRKFILAQIELNLKETTAPKEKPSIWTNDDISRSIANTKDRTKTTMVKCQHVNHLASWTTIHMNYKYGWVNSQPECLTKTRKVFFSNRSTSLQICSWTTCTLRFWLPTWQRVFFLF